MYKCLVASGAWIENNAANHLLTRWQLLTVHILVSFPGGRSEVESGSGDARDLKDGHTYTQVNAACVCP